MNAHHTTIALLFACMLQAAVLGGEYVNAVYPLWNGVTIKLKATPADPRSLFRGNYARLNYEIGRLPAALYQDDRRPRRHEVVYVALTADEAGVFHASSVALQPPDDGLFIRGRVRSYIGDDPLRIEYGIEAYFAPKREALALERRLRAADTFARVSLAANGKAALQDIIVD